jgi:hypothetical protein
MAAYQRGRYCSRIWVALVLGLAVDYYVLLPVP